MKIPTGTIQQAATQTRLPQVNVDVYFKDAVYKSLFFSVDYNRR